MENRKTVFNDKELAALPLTYRKMECTETSSVGELYKDSIFSKSKKHISNQYMVFVSYKPISNFIIDEEGI